MEIRQDATYEARLVDVVGTIRDTLRRRWLTLALVTAAVVALGVVAIYRITPEYAAAARVRIDPSRDPLSKTADTRTELSSEAIDTEVTAMYSLDLARSVVRNLKLVNDPEFQPVLSGADSAKLSTSSGRETAVANQVLENLDVYREKQTYILGVGFTSRDPIKAAKVANMFADDYIEARVGDKTGTAARQAEWFQKRVEDLAAEVRAADAAVAQFRAQSGLTQSTNETSGTIADQQVAPLSSSLASAQSDAAGARSNLSAAQSQVSRGGLDSVSEVLNSAVIADLRRQRAEVLRNKGEVEARYGSRHPESIKVHDQLVALDAQINAESRRVVGSLQASASSANARAASLKSSLDGLEARRAQDTRNSVLAESLEREAAAKRALYDRMSQQSFDSMQASRNLMSQASVIDRAEPPTKPTSPNKPLLLAIALLAGLAAGIGTIIVQELMSSGMRTTDEVEDQLGLPVLAAVPTASNDNPADLLIERPTSFFSESFRILRASVLGAREGKQAQVIAITSAVPGEGKTTTALAFARTLAIAGSKTLLLECDVRRAAMRLLVKRVSASAGLVEVLHRQASPEKAIEPGDVANLDHLLVLAPFYSSENLFGNGTMEKLLTELRERYDHIVLDLPPLIGLADGRFLAVLADVTALVVKWDDTPAKVSSSALSLIQNDGANPIGIIMTMVDSTAEMVGGHYYTRKYSDYYQEA